MRLPRQYHTFTWRKNFTTCSYWWKLYHAHFLSYIKHHIEDMATLITALENFPSGFPIMQNSWLGEIFIQRKFSHIRHSFIATDTILFCTTYVLLVYCTLTISRFQAVRSSWYCAFVSYGVYRSSMMTVFTIPIAYNICTCDKSCSAHGRRIATYTHTHNY